MKGNDTEPQYFQRIIKSLTIFLFTLGSLFTLVALIFETESTVIAQLFYASIISISLIAAYFTILK